MEAFGDDQQLVAVADEGALDRQVCKPRAFLFVHEQHDPGFIPPDPEKTGKPRRQSDAGDRVFHLVDRSLAERGRPFNEINRRYEAFRCKNEIFFIHKSMVNLNISRHFYHNFWKYAKIARKHHASISGDDHAGTVG